MALEFSEWTRSRIANKEMGGVDYDSVVTYEVKAYSNTINLDGTGGTEITADGYSPIEVDNDLTNFPATTNGEKANAAAFSRTFAEAASIKSIGIFDQTTGELWARKVYPATLEIAEGFQWLFPIASITYAANNEA